MATSEARWRGKPLTELTPAEVAGAIDWLRRDAEGDRADAVEWRRRALAAERELRWIRADLARCRWLAWVLAGLSVGSLFFWR